MTETTDGRLPGDSGVAFIIVLAVLMALMILAGPFLLTAENESSSSAIHLADALAKVQAESRVAYAR